MTSDIVYTGFGYTFNDIEDHLQNNTMMTKQEREIFAKIIESDELDDLIMNDDYEREANDPVTADGYVNVTDFFIYIPKLSCINDSDATPKFYTTDEAVKWLNYHTHVLFNAAMIKMKANGELNEYLTHELETTIDFMVDHMDIKHVAMEQSFVDGDF